MTKRKLITFYFLLFTASFPLLGREKAVKVVLNEEEFRDKVYACWLGKTIGGTLGMPFEGQREMHNLTFYDPIPREPVPNDDLDLQLLWLKALEENGSKINAHILGEYWLKYVIVDWNEYGIGKKNLRLGIPPPLSGHFRNIWRDSNGAWIRSEIWACIYPGLPSLAGKYAFEDACVDHGIAEGTYAEVFMAVLESSAFIERDKKKLLRIALSYIPRDCGVAKSVLTAIDCWERGFDWRTARERVVETSRDTGWFMAPQNVGFVVIGLLYGGDNFGKAVCTAVNCGDDSDCTGATVGAIWGILYGTKGIPKEWRQPISERIANIAVGGFQPPSTLKELTERVVKMAKIALKEHSAPVTISSRFPTTPSANKKLPLVDSQTIVELWKKSPYSIEYRFDAFKVTLDFQEEPFIEAGKRRSISLSFEDVNNRKRELVVECKSREEMSFSPKTAVVQAPGKLRISLKKDRILSEIIRCEIVILNSKKKEVGSIPLTLVGKLTVNEDDFALSKYGVVASSDSELEWEKGCTMKVNDGIIAGENDFEGKRWHSALTPHPHWVALHLPENRFLGRVIVHFADPQGHPVDFDGEVSLNGENWRTIFQIRNYENTRRFEWKGEEPILMKHFRLIIHKSSSRIWENAAQVSEIELLPK
ncbi:MAG: ADP-ribosylglycohydrolase family protein [Candidatus Bathyarchaeia archaeon]